MIKLAKIWLSIWVKDQFIWVKNSEQILGWRPASCSLYENSPIPSYFFETWPILMWTPCQGHIKSLRKEEKKEGTKTSLIMATKDDEPYGFFSLRPMNLNRGPLLYADIDRARTGGRRLDNP